MAAAGMCSQDVSQAAARGLHGRRRFGYECAVGVGRQWSQESQYNVRSVKNTFAVMAAAVTDDAVVQVVVVDLSRSSSCSNKLVVYVVVVVVVAVAEVVVVAQPL